MNFRIPRLPIAVAGVAAMVLASYPAAAAMPVAGASGLANDTGVIQVAKKKKMTRKQEIDKSVDSRTVPSRYRSSVPKEYQQYIPFAKQ